MIIGSSISNALNEWSEIKRQQFMSEKKENINHPEHYNSHPSGIEAIEVCEHMNFNLGNVMKYIWRTDHKNGLEDLKKARWYLDREINKRDGEERGVT